jgi:hypothetical protein
VLTGNISSLLASRLVVIINLRLVIIPIIISFILSLTRSESLSQLLTPLLITQLSHPVHVAQTG